MRISTNWRPRFAKASRGLLARNHFEVTGEIIDMQVLQLARSHRGIALSR
jgi:hypothetical protein